MALPEQSASNSHPGSGPSEKPNRSKRVLHDEDDYLVNCLVKLARGSKQNKNSSNGCITNPVRTPETVEPKKVDVQEVTSSSHICSMCHVPFSSGQALGGHMRRHTYALKKTTAAENLRTGVQDCVRKSSVHKCSVCGEEFKTGQALGGHKRKHYEREVDDAAAKSCSSDHSGAGVPGNMVRDFDLNEPPPEFLLCDESFSDQEYEETSPN